MTSLERGLEVLLATSEGPPRSVEEVARQLGMPLSTTYRYMRILRDLGYLQEDDAGLRGGPRLVQMALRSDPNRALAQLSDPIMSELVDFSDCTAFFSVRVGTMALCIHSVEPRAHIRLCYRLLTPQPLYAGASGKPLLAYAPTAVVDEVIAGGLPTFTAATPSAGRLRQQLEMIRASGYCVTVGELDEHVVAVGVPVFMGRTLVGALSVAGPEDRLGPVRVAVIQDRVVAAGHDLRRILERSHEPSPEALVADRSSRRAATS
jgi:IclR family acetate operon transcriptional repressor